MQRRRDFLRYATRAVWPRAGDARTRREEEGLRDGEALTAACGDAMGLYLASRFSEGHVQSNEGCHNDGNHLRGGASYFGAAAFF